jgi:hypothetical protein
MSKEEEVVLVKTNTDHSKTKKKKKNKRDIEELKKEVQMVCSDGIVTLSFIFRISISLFRSFFKVCDFIKEHVQSVKSYFSTTG